MKILEQLLREAGADTAGAITVIPAFGGYFSSVKRVEEYTPQKIVLLSLKRRIIVTGENLVIEKYFMQDLSVRGAISGVSVE